MANWTLFSHLVKRNTKKFRVSGQQNFLFVFFLCWMKLKILARKVWTRLKNIGSVRLAEARNIFMRESFNEVYYIYRMSVFYFYPSYVILLIWFVHACIENIFNSLCMNRYTVLYYLSMLKISWWLVKALKHLINSCGVNFCISQCSFWNDLEPNGEYMYALSC